MFCYLFQSCYLLVVAIFADLDFATFQLPVLSYVNPRDEVDMCPISEEFPDSNMDLLSIEPTHCAEQLTIMDAVSTHNCPKVHHFGTIPEKGYSD